MGCEEVADNLDTRTQVGTVTIKDLDNMGESVWERMREG